MTLRDEIKGMWATYREDVDTADEVADRILALVAEDRQALTGLIALVLDDWQEGYNYDLCESYTLARAALAAGGEK